MPKNKGVSIVEALIWFALFSIVIFGVFSIYKNTKNKENIILESKNIQFIFSRLQSVVMEDNSNEINNDVAGKLGILPESLKKSNINGDITNVWGGGVVLEYIDGKGYKLTYKNVPSMDCLAIVNSQKNVGWGKIESSTTDCITTIKQP